MGGQPVLLLRMLAVLPLLLGKLPGLPELGKLVDPWPPAEALGPSPPLLPLCREVMPPRTTPGGASIFVGAVSATEMLWLESSYITPGLV